MQLSAVSVQLKFMKCSDCRLQLYLSVVQFCGSKVQCSLMAMQCSCKAPKYSINQCIGETLLVVVRAVFHTVQQWWIVITQFRKKYSLQYFVMFKPPFTSGNSQVFSDVCPFHTIGWLAILAPPQITDYSEKKDTAEIETLNRQNWNFASWLTKLWLQLS